MGGVGVRFFLAVCGLRQDLEPIATERISGQENIVKYMLPIPSDIRTCMGKLFAQRTYNGEGSFATHCSCRHCSDKLNSLEG